VFVTFLSDFGLQDDFVGTCHGVIKRIAPAVAIIDITHGIEPQAVLQGALVLANTIPYMPEGVHLAVVDPGVGTSRRAVAIRDRSGRLYVGPDNGLLVPAAEKLGGVDGAWELTNPAYMLERISRTFHGRDVFAPAAAHLARGVLPEELGEALEPETLVRLGLPEPEIGESTIRATVLYIDRYGNVQLNLDRAAVERVGIVPGRQVELELGLERYYAVAGRTFADARPGDIVLYEDSYENIAIAITGGNAAQMFSARAGQPVTIRTVG
jgi:S-adenosylmethionine hydrolase